MNNVVQLFLTDVNNKWYHQNDGYFYCISRKKNSRWYLKCVEVKKNPPCRVLGSMAADMTGVIRITNNEMHNHPPNHDTCQVINFRKHCKELAVRDTRDVRKIIEDESVAFEERIIASTSSHSLARAMYHSRKVNAVRIPEDLLSYGRMILQHPENLGVTHAGEQFFITSTERCALFISPTTSRLLREATRFTMDGTFKCVPRKPKTYQLYTIGAIYKNVMIPIVYCLMTNKEQRDYEWLFEKIIEFEPRWNPRCIISDYEDAVMNVVENKFGEHVIQGCWFHYTQAIRRYCDKLGLKATLAESDSLHKFCKQIMALPLLPTLRIQRGFNILVQEAIGMEYTTDERVLNLLLYVRRQWLSDRMLRRISVHLTDIRTNNHMESFHSNIMRHMGGNRNGCHPNIWKFSRSLKKINHVYSSRYLSLRQGNRESWDMKRKWRFQNRRIRMATIALRNNRCTITQFLLRVLYATPNIIILKVETSIAEHGREQRLDIVRNEIKIRLHNRYTDSLGLSRTVNVIAFDYFYQKIMYKLDFKELLNELVLISDEEGDMATRARDIRIELVTKRTMLINQNRDLSVLMVAKKIAHNFMLNRNFDLIQDETFDLWDDSIKQAKYKFLCKPEYVFRLNFIHTMGEKHVAIMLERILNDDVKSIGGTLKNLPEFTDISVDNDEYRIEQLLLYLARTFSVLWSRFGGSSVSPGWLPQINLDPNF